MNISGVRRQLALFQPPINPMLLVRARAAGLSIEDIEAGTTSNLPPYRFSYLIEKAKQFTQTVQSFGSALLSALEKKDVEELTLLRSTHEREILQMTKAVKQQQIKDAEAQYQAMYQSQMLVKAKIYYYERLIETGLTDWEITQQVSQHIATGLRLAEAVLHISEALGALLPNVGSPFAMTYGGKQLKGSFEAWASWSQTMASIAKEMAASAGLEATFQRREEEWQHQLTLAQRELKQVEQQKLAAEVRQEIAKKDLEIHEASMGQADELYDFYKTKFTNLGLYNYLATTLNRLYREAYNVAHGLALMAERAYQFERDDVTPYILADNWQFDRAGLLAGERLLLQLQRMEKAYLENHIRDYEITQSFSLALLNPSALVTLRATGNCNFTIPEIIFDLFYPGQYKRLIKSVRLTIPCVTGQYTNVSAKLTLLNSWVRPKDKLNTDTLDNSADQRRIADNTSISTSSAQNDAGMFELNFRDERYLPFEGAGAISSWRLDLPSVLRPFDYNTISDVIIHLSYTAKEDGTFRTTVETNIATTLTNFATDPGLYRLLSLKYEFPTAFHRLLHPTGATQTTEFDIGRQHFPYFLADKTLNLSNVTVYLQPKGKDAILTASPTIEVNDVSASAWTPFLDTNLQEAGVLLSGDPIRTWTIEAATGGLDPEKIGDILILLRYTAPTS